MKTNYPPDHYSYRNSEFNNLIKSVTFCLLLLFALAPKVMAVNPASVNITANKANTADSVSPTAAPVGTSTYSPSHPNTQQRKTITGTITDEAGESIIGANVMEKGTQNGTVTDVEGKFSLQVKDKAVLVISYIGYDTREIHIKNKAHLSIVLAEDTKALEEVVVIGYGTIKKEDLTGSISSVSDRQFKDQPVKRVGDILQGRTSGVEVTTLSGMPGGSMKVRVRGTTSINKSSDPLYIVDGIVGSGLDGINPSDIQSVEVLKDASATAIYGSRGANGVVLVTTRRGTEGRTQITFDTEVGVSGMLKRYDLLNAYEYALALNEIKGSSTISAEDLEAYKNGTKGIDWQDVMTQTGISQDYKLSISGGNAKSRYFVSANVLDQEAITVTTNLKRYAIRANIDSEVTPWLTLSANINGAKMHTHNGSVDLMEALNYSPTMEMKDEETGIYNKDPYNGIGANPYGERVADYNDSYQYHLNGSASLLFKIADDLTFNMQGGYNYTHNPAYSFTSELKAPGTINSMTNSSGLTRYWQNTNNLTFKKEFGDHSLMATAVWETSNTVATTLSVTGSNLKNEDLGYWSFGNASTKSQSNGYTETAMASGLVRLMYNYKNRYFLTGTFRADGSSKFQGNNKWGYFPSGAVAWDISKEGFMADRQLFQQLKLRASYGVTGNQDISAYSTLGMLSSTSYGWGTSTDYTGYWANSFATPGVRWEETHQYDAGFDATLLNSRLLLTVDGFVKQSKDLLFQKQVPMFNGGGTYWANQGEVKNSGVEFSVTAFPVEGNNFSWETGFNGTYVKNEIISLAGEDFILDGNWSALGGAAQIMKPGYPLGSFYLYRQRGFDNNGATLYEKADGSLTTSPTAEDQTIMGQANPTFTFGWNNMINWKNWSFGLFLSGATGFDRLNMTHYATASMTGMWRFITLRDAYFLGWDKVEDKADAQFPSLVNPDNKSYVNSDAWLEDASFLKVRNVSISYRIPRNVLGFGEVELSISGQNLFTLTKYKGLDPEVYNSYTGMDYGAYPVPRTFTFGAKITL